MKNFKLIGGFGIPQKSLQKDKKTVYKIIDKYHNLGIEEFFVGYNPNYWYKKFGFEFSPNGRFGENEQVTNLETLKMAVDYIHSLKCEIFLAVNGWFYSDITMPLVEKIISEGLDLGVDGIIVGNIETLMYLASINYKGKVNFSTILSLYNTDAIEFMIDFCEQNNLKLNRIILPRELTLKEIKDICNYFPKHSFEVFGHGDYCRYANGLCYAEHKYTTRDLCTFVLKQGFEVKKTIKYDFKKTVLEESITDEQKQNSLDNELNDIEDLFVSQTVVNSSKNFDSFDKIIDKILSGDGDLNDKIFGLIYKEITYNFDKYIWDGLKDEKDFHNQFINKFLRLWNILEESLENKKSNEYKLIKEKIKLIEKYKIEGIKYFEGQIRTKHKFGLEAYYKLMLYNRTSMPFMSFFNNIKNIDVVKIPLRGRDEIANKMNLDLIDEAIENPKKFINPGNVCGKYFHYDKIG